jgi:hypothetical protein
MELFKGIIKWGGLAMGFLLSIVNTVATAREVSTWGLPIWAWYAIGLTIFSGSAFFIIFGFWQENRRFRSNEVRWIRQEVIKNRQIYSKAKHLPTKLVMLHKFSAGFMKELRVSKKDWASLEPEFKKTVGWLRGIICVIILRTPMFIITRIKLLQSFVYEIIFDLDSVLKSAGIDTLSENETYLKLYDEIDEYRIGLPEHILQKVTTYILLANMLDMLYLFNPSQPFMKGVSIPTRTRVLLPYLTLAIDTNLGKLSSQVAHDIERFLVGD